MDALILAKGSHYCTLYSRLKTADLLKDIATNPFVEAEELEPDGESLRFYIIEEEGEIYKTKDGQIKTVLW